MHSKYDSIYRLEAKFIYNFDNFINFDIRECNSQRC
jgi:hypothetical protein